jgi:CIC family chloride channel protein
MHPVLPPFPQPNIGSETHPLSPRFWALTILTGIFAGLSSVALMELLYAVQRMAWGFASGGFLAAVRHSSGGHRFAVVLAAGLLAGVVKRLLSRGNKGHAGDLSEAVWLRDGEMEAAPTIASAILSIVIVGMGASLGREGALKQAGAVIASRLSAWVNLLPHERRLLVACGAGAGMAAAYNVPFGGALFALEVLLGTISLTLVLPALTASLLATAISWIFLQDRPTYTISLLGAPASLMAWALVAGPLLGIFSVGYIRVIAWADSLKPRGWRAVAAPVLAFGLLGFFGIFFPEVLGNGRDLVQEIFSDQLFGGLLPILLILKVAMIATCLGSGAPGGLFTPTITCGALLGSSMGIVWTRFWPGAPPASFAIAGAGAVLAATAKSPVSTLVMLIELTQRLDSSTVPMMLALIVATLVAQRFEPRSIYTARLSPMTLTPPGMAAGPHLAPAH